MGSVNAAIEIGKQKLDVVLGPRASSLSLEKRVTRDHAISQAARGIRLRACADRGRLVSDRVGGGATRRAAAGGDSLLSWGPRICQEHWSIGEN
jgi:hypothetical protein